MCYNQNSFLRCIFRRYCRTAAREKPDSGRVELLELEQAKMRVEELRVVIEKYNRL